MNAALAMIAGARPKDEIEGALTVLSADDFCLSPDSGHIAASH